MGCSSSQPAAEQQNSPRRRPGPATAVTREPQEGGDRNATASFAASIVGWDKDLPLMTASQLQAKRLEFWDTRVQGRPECWQAIRVAVESAEADGDAATAQVILESAEMTPLDTERTGYCFTYDSKGFKYEIPLYCLYQPSNLLRDPAPPAKTSARDGQPLQVQPAPQQKAAAPSPDEMEAELQEGTGKVLKFKIRFSNGTPDLTLDQRASCSIGQLKNLIHSKYPDLSPDRTRIYYLGKFMSQDKWNLGEIGLKKEMVLQCFVPFKKEL